MLCKILKTTLYFYETKHLVKRDFSKKAQIKKFSNFLKPLFCFTLLNKFWCLHFACFLQSKKQRKMYCHNIFSPFS